MAKVQMPEGLGRSSEEEAEASVAGHKKHIRQGELEAARLPQHSSRDPHDERSTFLLRRNPSVTSTLVRRRPCQDSTVFRLGRPRFSPPLYHTDKLRSA